MICVSLDRTGLTDVGQEKPNSKISQNMLEKLDERRKVNGSIRSDNRRDELG